MKKEEERRVYHCGLPPTLGLQKSTISQTRSTTVTYYHRTTIVTDLKAKGSINHQTN